MGSYTEQFERRIERQIRYLVLLHLAALLGLCAGFAGILLGYPAGPLLLAWLAWVALCGLVLKRCRVQIPATVFKRRSE